MMTAQELVRSNQFVRQEFDKWHGTQPAGACSVDAMLDRMTALYWKMFCRSPQGKKCLDAGIDIKSYSVGASVAAKPLAPVVEPPQPTIRRCVKCNNKADAFLEIHTCGRCLFCCTCPPEMRECCKCGKEFLCEDHSSPVLCKECTPQGMPAQPVRETVPAVAATPAPVSSNPLIAALITELQNAGYTPAQAVSARECQSIAESAALEVASIVVEQLKREGLGTAKQIVEIRQPGKPTVQLQERVPVWFPRLRKLAACGTPALLIGPAGCGKTTGAKLLAKSMGLPFYRISIAAGTDEGQLQGWLLPVGDGMKFEYVPSVLSHAFEDSERGGVVLIDDIDLGDPNALGILNAPLDNGGWYIPLRHKNPLFVRSDRFYIMGASNTAGNGADRKFVGANQLDERTLSRFRMGQIPCDYDEALERDLYDASVVEFGQMLRARCRALPSLEKDVSTRDIESCHTMLDQFTLGEAWYGFFAAWHADHLRQVHARIDHTAMSVELD